MPKRCPFRPRRYSSRRALPTGRHPPRQLSPLGVAKDGHDPAGLSHCRAARFEALRAGRPVVNIRFCAAAREVRC